MPEPSNGEPESHKPDAELKKLEDAQAKTEAELKKLEATKGMAEGYETRVAALKKEEERLKSAILSYREEKRKKDLTFQEQFRKEQQDKATAKFFQEYGYSEPEAQKKLLDAYKKIDDGSVDAENIYKNLEKSHLLVNSPQYIALEKKVKEMAGSAEEFLKQQSSSAFAEGGTAGEGGVVVLDAEDEEAVRKFHIPREKYIELKQKGLL